MVVLHTPLGARNLWHTLRVTWGSDRTASTPVAGSADQFSHPPCKYSSASHCPQRLLQAWRGVVVLVGP
jgi:hypothetical protein